MNIILNGKEISKTAEELLEAMKNESLRMIEATHVLSAKNAWYYSHLGSLDFARQMGLISEERRQELYQEFSRAIDLITEQWNDVLKEGENMTNKKLARLLYENEKISFGMIDEPNIIITNGAINYDNGFFDEYNKNAIAIFAKDLHGLFKHGMILKESSIGIQAISINYIEFLLNNKGLSREDCLFMLSKCMG